MENLKIDEKHLENLVEVYEDFLKKLNTDLVDLKDKKLGVFTRYMAYWRLRNLAKVVNAFTITHKEAMIAGHLVNHEHLLTQEAKELGWDELNLHKNPFFINDVEQNNDESKGELGELLAKILLRVAIP